MTTTPEALPDATKLAVERTRLAHERTLMAWVRTSTSLISFGFSIYKFFQYLHEGSQRPEQVFGPREFALAMILAGIAVLVLAVIEHRFSMRRLRADYGTLVPRSLAMIAASFIAFLGVFGLVMVFFHQ